MCINLVNFLTGESHLDELDCNIFVIPKILISSTAIFSYLEKIEKDVKMCPIFFNIIPYGSYTLCSLSWFKDNSELLDNFRTSLYTNGSQYILQ